MVRNGEHGKARDILLSKLSSMDIPRSYVLKFADLARRVNMPKTLVSVLRPIVLEEFPGSAPATTSEKALYATGLSRLGSFASAQEILKDLDDNEAPEVLLFQAHNFMFQWDDLSAIPKLRKFIAHPAASSYLRGVGKINLAACLISQLNWEEGQRVLADLREEIAAATPTDDFLSFRLLYANSLELSAQSAVMQGQLDLALAFIQRGEEFLQDTRSRYEILLKKWRVIVDLLKHPKNPESLPKFLSLKNEALKARNWETLRDLEFYQAIALRDDHLFIKLFHGSPYSSFRKRIKELYRPNFPVPKVIDWNPHEFEDPLNESKPTAVFDIKHGREIGKAGSTSLLESPLLGKLLKILTQDFYRPLSIGALIANLYEGEHYNPISSPEKAIQAVKRLRRWFSENEIPLDIEQVDTTFKLVSTKPYSIRLSYRQEAASKNSVHLERLFTHYSNQIFTAREIAEELEIPLSSARTFLSWAVKNRKVTQLAAGRSARYKIPSRFPR
jgi:hypothetical protein